MLTIMQNFNDMQKYLVAVSHSKEIENEIWNIKDQLREMDSNSTSAASNSSKKRRRELESSLEHLQPENIASEIFDAGRSGFSPLIAESFSRVYGLMFSDDFEIKIVSQFDENLAVRGILNRQYLREDPTSTYAKYGSRPSVNWTMVGQVTSVKSPDCSPETNVAVAEQELPKDDSEPETTPGLRPSFENLYATIADIEELIIGPGNRTTWIATPLSIFHEVN